jgi:restriction system protein
MVLRPIIKGWMGELKSKVTQGLLLDSKVYHTFNNLIIEDELGTTQIDHVIVSRYGIFVVETKNMDGWIYGSEKGKEWTQTFYSHKTRFQNPLHQNFRHTKTLSACLEIEHEKLFPAVIFWGDCEFKTRMPENVIQGSLVGCTGYIKRFTRVIFSDAEVEEICSRIQAVKDKMGFFSGLRHISDVQTRYGSNTVCPKCGGTLVERKGKRGPFLGCSRYPSCRYTKEIHE